MRSARACRFVPNAGAKSEAAAKQDASKHTYLPEAGAKSEVPIQSFCTLACMRCLSARFTYIAVILTLRGVKPSAPQQPV